MGRLKGWRWAKRGEVGLSVLRPRSVSRYLCLGELDDAGFCLPSFVGALQIRYVTEGRKD